MSVRTEEIEINPKISFSISYINKETDSLSQKIVKVLFYSGIITSIGLIGMVMLGFLVVENVSFNFQFFKNILTKNHLRILLIALGVLGCAFLGTLLLLKKNILRKTRKEKDQKWGFLSENEEIKKKIGDDLYHAVALDGINNKSIDIDKIFHLKNWNNLIIILSFLDAEKNEIEFFEIFRSKFLEFCRNRNNIFKIGKEDINKSLDELFEEKDKIKLCGSWKSLFSLEEGKSLDSLEEENDLELWVEIKPIIDFIRQKYCNLTQ